jgi:hypothetical protein
MRAGTFHARDMRDRKVQRNMRVSRAEGGGIAGSRYRSRGGEIESKKRAASEWERRTESEH